MQFQISSTSDKEIPGSSRFHVLRTSWEKNSTLLEAEENSSRPLNWEDLPSYLCWQHY